MHQRTTSINDFCLQCADVWQLLLLLRKLEISPKNVTKSAICKLYDIFKLQKSISSVNQPSADAGHQYEMNVNQNYFPLKDHCVRAKISTACCSGIAWRIELKVFYMLKLILFPQCPYKGSKRSSKVKTAYLCAKKANSEAIFWLRSRRVSDTKPL